MGSPEKFTPGHYSKVLKWISQKISSTFLGSRCSDESKFKTELEIISLLIRLAERTALELKSLGIKDEFINGFDGLAAIWKYLIRNISFDFDNKTIDYYSLFRTINEIRFIVKTDSSSNGPSLRISKRYALLWFYLRYIYNNDAMRSSIYIIIIARHLSFILSWSSVLCLAAMILMNYIQIH